MEELSCQRDKLLSSFRTNSVQRPTNPIILKLNIDLGDLVKILEVRQNDDIHQLAIKFCQENDLDDENVETIKITIIQNLKQIFQSQNDSFIQQDQKRDQLQNVSIEEIQNQFEFESQLDKSKNEQSTNGDLRNSLQFNNLIGKEKAKLLKRYLTSTKNTKNRELDLDHNKVNKHNKKQNHSQQIKQQQNKKQHNYSQQKSLISQADENNYGLMQYEKGIQFIRQKQKKIQKHQKQIVDQQQEECKFRPEINKMSSYLNSTKRRNKTDNDELIRKKTDSYLDTEKYKQLQEMEECSFKPKINQMSKYISQQKQHNIDSDRNQHLYSLFSKSKTNQKNRTEYSFKPQINKTSENLVKGNFKQRNREYIENLKQKKKLQYQQQLNNIDPSTGKQLFRPQVKQNKERVGSFEQNLQKQIQTSNSKKEQIQQKYYENLYDNQFQANDISKQIVEQKKSEMFESIFQSLDSQNLGFLQYKDIEMEQLDPQILEFIYPLLLVLQQTQQRLEYSTYHELVSDLYKKLDVHQKTCLLNVSKQTPQQQQHSFKPKINKNSRKLGDKQFNRFFSMNCTYNDLNSADKVTMKINHENSYENQFNIYYEQMHQQSQSRTNDLKEPIELQDLIVEHQQNI